MDKIKVVVLNESVWSPVGMTGMLAKLTQRGHKVTSAEDLIKLYSDSLKSTSLVDAVVKMCHGSVIRHTPVTIAIIGGSRRLLAQLRTHHVGIDWVSASLQYSDYSGSAQFVVPYEILVGPEQHKEAFLKKCKEDLDFYEEIVEKGYSNDTAGYVMNQALRNVLVATANHEAWLNVINRRVCRRNTTETAYVAALIWKALLYDTTNGLDMFKYAGPDCLYGKCSEGKFSCGIPFTECDPAKVICNTWPLVKEEEACS